MKLGGRWLLSIVLLVCGARAAHAQASKPLAVLRGEPRSRAATLDERVRAETGAFKGKVYIYAKNLDTGATYELNGDERVKTASTIKLPIMVEAFARVAAGRAKWSDELVLTERKKVGGSGILFEFHDGLKLTLRDALHLMIVVSDNTATNLVLDELTTDAVNARMDTLGLKQTRVLRKVFGGGESKAGQDPALKPFGLGVTTPHEMVTLVEKIYRGEIVSKEASKEMIEIMRRQQYHGGIGRTLNGVVPIASKHGALDRLRSDVGIIYSKRGPIAMAITADDMPDVNWTDDNPGFLLLARLSLILIDGLGQ
ncbi:MAG TPA: serine hydrolase [Pyrinomonadaceae bacterium]